MAQRLATVYVKTCLQLSEAEMLQLIRLFAEHHVQFQVKVTENGTQEMVFHDETGKEIVLTFEKKLGKYVYEATCTKASPRLANLLRKAVSEFRGDAIVHRIYEGFTMEYRYLKGTVVRISDLRDGIEKVIYEFKDTLGQLEELFLNTSIEEEIQSIQQHIDAWLDRRNEASADLEHIDTELHKLHHRLFVLEA
jgi:hypothetical protein